MSWAKSLFLPFVLLLPWEVVAQDPVVSDALRFSDGVHPTLAMAFESTDARYVEGFWQDQLRRVAMRVDRKREVVASGVRLPEVSEDTLRIQMKAVMHKEAPFVTVHMAFLTTSGHVAPGGDAQAYEAARSYLWHHGSVLRRQLLQHDLTQADKHLARVRTELSLLIREHERAQVSLERTERAIQHAVAEQEQAQADLDEIIRQILAKTAEQGAPSEEEEREDDRPEVLEKQEARARRRLEKAEIMQRATRKKVDELTWSIRRNEEAQERKRMEVLQQEAFVTSLREKLAVME